VEREASFDRIAGRGHVGPHCRRTIILW
jgi:hypothetical protein